MLRYGNFGLRLPNSVMPLMMALATPLDGEYTQMRFNVDFK